MLLLVPFFAELFHNRGFRKVLLAQVPKGTRRVVGHAFLALHEGVVRTQSSVLGDSAGEPGGVDSGFEIAPFGEGEHLADLGGGPRDSGHTC